MMTRGSNLLAVLWLILVLAAALLAPVISPINPYHPVAEPLVSPSSFPPLGTDNLGRDLWTRLLYGSRYSPGASLVATMITLLVGGSLGLASAALGGRADRMILGAINAALAVPSLLLAMLLVTGLGPRLTTVILAIGFGGAPGFARITRTMFLQTRERGFVLAAESFGASRVRIAVRHLLPNARGQMISLVTTYFAWAFLGTTTLTFLGLAGDPAIPEWGSMLNQGRAYLLAAPWLALWPGLMISITILAVHRLGLSLAGEKPTSPVR